jgi:hypothetical protein
MIDDLEKMENFNQYVSLTWRSLFYMYSSISLYLFC